MDQPSGSSVQGRSTATSCREGIGTASARVPPVPGTSCCHQLSMAPSLWMLLQVLDGRIGQVAQGSHDCGSHRSIDRAGQRDTAARCCGHDQVIKLQISVQSSLFSYFFSPTLGSTMNRARGFKPLPPLPGLGGNLDVSGGVRLDEPAAECVAVCRRSERVRESRNGAARKAKVLTRLQFLELADMAGSS